MAGAGSPLLSVRMQRETGRYSLADGVTARAYGGEVPTVGDLWLLNLGQLLTMAERLGVPLGRAHYKADVVWVMARWFEVKAEERGTPGTPGRWK